MRSLPGRFPLLPRLKRADKSRFGHTLVIAGSKGMMGAAFLAARACAASGSGLTTLALPAPYQGLETAKIPEVMRLGLSTTQAGSISSKALAATLRFIKEKKINAVAIGPGLSVHPDTVRFVRRFVKNCPVPVVADADAINAFKGKSQELRSAKSAVVLTPHEREFERIFSEKAPSAVSQRAKLAKSLSKFYHVILVLKGHRTVVINGDDCYVNRTGNPGMAKGGSGDVLTGMIGAFIAQGLKPFQAACWAVYFHGLAGDMAVKKHGELSLFAGHLIEALPAAFNRH